LQERPFAQSNDVVNAKNSLLLVECRLVTLTPKISGEMHDYNPVSTHRLVHPLLIRLEIKAW